MRFLLFALLLLLPLPAPAQTRSNIILIVADDLGNDLMSVDTYDEEVSNQDPVTKMPTLDTMAANGVLFRNAYSNSVCSPTRATLMSGHNALHYRNQIGAVVSIGAASTALMDTSWDNLPAVLKANGYRTEVYGKWHLANEPGWDRNVEGVDGTIDRTESHPNDFGFDTAVTMSSGPLAADYVNWQKWTNGVYSNEADYNTSYLIDQAISSGDATKGIRGSEPFFIYLPFAAVHSPLHQAPVGLVEDLTYYSVGGWRSEDKLASMIEAMDTEIGRLFSDGNFDWTDTTVFVMSDNGTDSAVCVVDYAHNCKGTFYEGGINVPLIVRGQAVAAAAKGQEATGLVQATDIYATILDIAGLFPPDAGRDAISAKSYLATPGQESLRGHVTIQSGSPNGGPFIDDPYNWTAVIRDSRYKMNWTTDEFYDLVDDPYETTPIDTGTLTGAQQTAYDAIVLRLLQTSPRPFCNGPNYDVRRLQ